MRRWQGSQILTPFRSNSTGIELVFGILPYCLVPTQVWHCRIQCGHVPGADAVCCGSAGTVGGIAMDCGVTNWRKLSATGVLQRQVESG